MKNCIFILIIILLAVGLIGCSADDPITDAVYFSDIYAVSIDAPVGRSNTYVIAFSDAPEIAKAQSDIVVSGNADDEFQNAIDAGYKNILMTEGNGTFGQKVDGSTNNNLTIQGQGEASIITLADNVDDDAFLFGDGTTYVHDIRLLDFQLQGNLANNALGSGIHLYSVESTYITRVHIQSFNDMGIIVEGTGARASNYTYITDCYILGNNDGGVYVPNQSYRVVLSNNVINSNGGGGFRTSGSSLHVITGNVFNGNAMALRLYNCWYSTISGNSMINQSGAAIYADGGASWNNYTGNIIISPSNGSPDVSSGIVMDGDYNVIVGNHIAGITNRINAAVHEGAGADWNFIEGNYLYNALTPVILVGANTIIRDNTGFISENSGLATITNGTTSILVTHGLSLTPDINKISIMALENPTNPPGLLWTTNVTATQFTINCAADPGASNLDIGWNYRN